MRNVLCYSQRSEESFFRLEGFWKDYQTRIWVRQNGRQKVINRGFYVCAGGVTVCAGGLDIKI